MLFILYFAATTLMAIVLVVGWYISPLWLGFEEWPADPLARTIADVAYRASYFIAMPALIAGQIASAILGSKGQDLWAYLLPIATILLFAASAGTTLMLIAAR